MKSEPVLTAGAVVGVIMSALTMAVALGWLSLGQGQMQTVEAFLASAVPLVLSLAAAYWARARVTPLAAPKTADGESAVLMPEQDVIALRSEAASGRLASAERPAKPASKPAATPAPKPAAKPATPAASKPAAAPAAKPTATPAAKPPTTATSKGNRNVPNGKAKGSGRSGA